VSRCEGGSRQATPAPGEVMKITGMIAAWFSRGDIGGVLDLA
jgi:hypothetical protein